MEYKIRDVTPKAYQCAWGTCPSINEAERKDQKVYLIVGKVVNPADAGIEKKVGEGEALIEVPRGLIDGIVR